MIKVAFGIVHRDCLVNELSRKFPRLQIVCPGGFRTGKQSVEEILALATNDKRQVEAVLGYLRSSQGVIKAEWLATSGRFVFLLLATRRIPKTGFVSAVVAKNRCFRLVFEVQEGGIEKWVVGCVSRGSADHLLADLARLGPLNYATISEVSYGELMKSSVATRPRAKR